MKAIITTIFCLLISFHSYSENYVKGYIVTNNNDTIRGYIDFRIDRINAVQCAFKTAKSTSEKIYYPEDIAGYILLDEGKYYVSREITIGENTQKLFLEYLVKGTMDLFYFENKDEQRYYVFEDNINQNTTIITKKKDQMEDYVIRKDNKYKGVLQYTFRDYNTIKDMAVKMDFNQKSMIQIAQEYHKLTCKTGEPCIVFELKNPDKSYIKTKFSIYGGIQFNNYSYSNSFLENTAIEGKVKTSSSPMIGGQLNICNPRWSKSLSAVIDLSLSSLKIKIANKSNYYDKTFKYNSLFTTSRIGMKYTFLPQNKFMPCIEAGGLLSLFFEKEGTLKSISTYGNIYEYKYDLQSLGFGYFVAGGVNYRINNKHSLLFRIGYEHTKGLDGIVDWGNKNKSPIIKLGIEL